MILVFFLKKTYVYTKTCKGTCIAPLFVVTQTESNPKTLNRERNEETITCLHSGITQQLKVINYWHKQKHGEISKVLGKMKNAGHKALHAML